MARLVLMNNILLKSRKRELKQRRDERQMMRYTDKAFSMPENEFKANYRVSKDLYEEIYQNIKAFIPTPKRRSDIQPKYKICDADLKILSVDASFGGASHDSFVWNQHPIKQHLINLNNNGENVYLLGKYYYENSDSGYAQREYMMTPIVDAPAGSPEEYYTKLHCSARNTVERTIGVLKNRWRCLLGHRVLHYHPDVAAKIINACCVLHNMCINRIGFDENIANDGNENPDANSQEVNSTSAAELRQGIAKRAVLVQQLWASRR
ncbi:hypothetical protein HW555_009189 [Spodoptera exigua]|uniref:DDE Tnp4 domain-containing protein n=1 Tax=Spodoptera exigua TaxID=7107 RepID=A0A835GBM5_SPOEX|nr:hypothetical protein HW555_009189 [Spodoptera exigua]